MLTKTERWILHNQHAILQFLDKNDPEHHAQVCKALMKGYEAEYELQLDDFSDPMPREESELVSSILQMYQVIQRADPTRRFPGFSLNSETRYFGYARFLREKDHFTDVVVHVDGDSHLPMLGKYGQMLAAWEASADKFQLTKDDLARILKAGGMD